MKERVFVSTGVFGPRPLREIVVECKALGICGLELSSGAPAGEAMMELLQRERKGMDFLVHNYFPPPRKPFVLNLAAQDSRDLELSMSHCRSAMTMCAKLGVPFYSVHSGFAFDARPEHLGQSLTQAASFPLEQAEDTFIESLKSLCDFGSKINVRLLIENNVVTRANLVHGKNSLLLGAAAGDLNRIYEKVRKDNLGFLVDVGHLNVTARTLVFNVGDFFDEIGDHIEAFHLSGNDGLVDDNQPFDANAWFVPYVRAFPKAVRVLEAYRLDRTALEMCLKTMKQEF